MKKLVFIILCLIPVAIWAADNAQTTEDKIKLMLVSRFPKVNIVSIRQSMVPNLYQVETNADIIYVSSDATYFIAGDLYMLDKSGYNNVSDSYRNEARKQVMAAVKDSDVIIFSPQGKSKASITVLTDVDCAYCRNLHSEIAQINALGIEVRYMAFPRAGIGSDTYNKMVSIWCADDRKDALTKAKLGQNIPTKTCENPVAKEYEMGLKFGMRGTPGLLFNDGRLLQSYLPPDVLAKELGVVVSTQSNATNP